MKKKKKRKMKRRKDCREGGKMILLALNYKIRVYIYLQKDNLEIFKIHTTKMRS